MGLYIHVPFCAKICPYCDFAKIRFKHQDEEAYFKAIQKEVQAYAHQFPGLKIRTLYFGGGTPSLLSVKTMKRLLHEVHYQLDFSECQEKTIEVNPGNIHPEKLNLYQQYGITRISLGVQSFHDEDLKFLGRNHTVQTTLNTYELLKKKGFHNISIDWMIGLPKSLEKPLQESCCKIEVLNPAHLSIYGLTIKKGTPFYRHGVRAQADDPMMWTLKKIRKQLLNAGYTQYEFSSYAKPGFESKHNLMYWRYQHVIGLGPGAHSFFMGQRYQHAKSMATYLKNPIPNIISRPGNLKKKPAAQKQAMLEFLISCLRYHHGFSKKYFHEIFGEPIDKRCGLVISELQTLKLIRRHKTHIQATLKGWYLMDELLTAFSEAL